MSAGTRRLRKAWIRLVGAALFAPTLLAANAGAQTMSMDAGHHEPLVGHLLVDQLEYRLQKGKDAIAWDAQAWYGGDYEKVYFKSLGEAIIGAGGASEAFEKAEFQLLYSRLVGYYWDVQGGVRYDVRPDPQRAYAVIGLQGLAPGFFELDLQGFVSHKGDISARLEGEYDLYVTQRLVAQPKFEVDLALQDVPELGVGRGISDIELGLRVRYEFVREFAPYVGVSWERAVGRSASYARDEGEDVSKLSLVTGIRFWF